MPISKRQMDKRSTRVKANKKEEGRRTILLFPMGMGYTKYVGVFHASPTVTL